MVTYDVIDPDKDQQVCETVCRLIPEADIIYLYGSYNSAYETAESDIDYGTIESNSCDNYGGIE